MLTPLGSFYVDLVQDVTGLSRPTLINRNPEPSETGASETGSLYLTVIDVGAAGLLAGATTIRVVSNFGDESVFNGASFTANWSTSTYTTAVSDGAGPVDEHRFVLKRTGTFSSTQVITVIVHAETIDAQILNTSYSFTIRDYVAPTLSTIATKGLKTLELKFGEAVVQGTGVAGDALRVRSLPRPELIAPNDLSVNVDSFASSDVGLYIAIDGAVNSVNNTYRKITAFVSARRVTLDTAVVKEILPITAIATVGPYKLEYVKDTSSVIPGFTPVILSAKAGTTTDTVTLELSQELTQSSTYKITPFQVDDLFGNRLATEPTQFTSEPLPKPPDRKLLDLINSLPRHNFAEDTSRDLERFIRCFQDPTDLLLYNTDRFSELMDPDLAPENALDVLLVHLGNPFSFVASMSADDKRRLIGSLVTMYRKNGCEIGMEAVINFILGVPVNVRPYLGLEGTWALGTSELGINTVLGPGTQFLKYAFEVVSPINLTTSQKSVLNEIANYMKPAHTHYVRLLEPGSGGLPASTTYWVLGQSALGYGTRLGL